MGNHIKEGGTTRQRPSLAGWFFCSKGDVMSSLSISDWQAKPKIADIEHKVLEYWESQDTFRRSVHSRPQDNRYVFYDGPPFATGTPHFGHILVSTIKDVFPRFKTMKGYRVDRVWGWDCHGLPIENIVEKQLDLKGGKKGIEALGIDVFNQACRAAIWKFDKEWERVINRIGRWVDFKHSYKTMDVEYMESVWWAFSQLYQKQLVYEGRKVMLYCSRCATPLSNFEIAMDNSYQDDEDNSIIVKFQLATAPHEFLLAWTTTPWTLLGNVALAVNPEASYVKIKIAGEIYILAQDRLGVIRETYQVLEELPGKKLVNLAYIPLYEYLKVGDAKAFYVTDADFVSLEDGTGIVHTAAMYGEDDFALAQKRELPLVPMLDDQGKFLDFVTPLSGQYYKKTEQWVIDDLASRGLIYKSERIIHSVAHCYRCNTQLFYNALPAWFVAISSIKPDLLKHNESINWYPDHLKHGRFGKGLETAPDWNISRSRYWGTPIPIWKSKDGSQMRVISSRQELREWAVDPNQLPDLSDIHREFVDDIEVWVDDDKTVKGQRIPEVFDCWVESGSMPFASLGYPLSNKSSFEQAYPAQFITEYIAQTRAWFYTLHVLSVAIFGTHSFENALTTGNILAEDGSKMSKSKKNYPDPEPLFEKYGVDALRFYLMSSQVMKADNTNFSEQGVREVYQKVISPLINCVAFVKMYAPNILADKDSKPVTALDRYLASCTATLVTAVEQALETYDTITATKHISSYINELSTWYLRLSREQIKSNTHSASFMASMLLTVAKVIAPITPFMAEFMYHQLVEKPDSIHLLDWPSSKELSLDHELVKQMKLTQAIVEALHRLRQEVGIKVKQPLAAWGVRGDLASLLPEELHEVVLQEVNIKAVRATPPESLVSTLVEDQGREIEIWLDTTLTPALLLEGQARELIRSIQALRKRQQIPIGAPIRIIAPSWPKDFEAEILSKTQATSLVEGEQLAIESV